MKRCWDCQTGRRIGRDGNTCRRVQCMRTREIVGTNNTCPKWHRRRPKA